MVQMTFRGSTAASFLILSLTAVLMVDSTSCLVRRRLLTRKGGQPTQTLLTADKDTLIREVAQRYAAIDTLKATVDMVPAIGTANKGKITEYKDFLAYILFRKPTEIRLIGLYPVVRNPAFDMVSDGSQFRVYIPGKGRFLEGLNSSQELSENKFENLRPQHFLDALLVRPIDPAHDLTFLVDLTDEDSATYVLIILSKNPNGELALQRLLFFDRLTLRIARQLILNPSGEILTDASYNSWQLFDNVFFPKTIDIDRPKDEYGVVITVVKLDINKPLTNAQFDLQQPPGTELRIIGAVRTTPAPAGQGNPKK